MHTRSKLIYVLRFAAVLKHRVLPLLALRRRCARAHVILPEAHAARIVDESRQAKRATRYLRHGDSNALASTKKNEAFAWLKRSSTSSRTTTIPRRATQSSCACSKRHLHRPTNCCVALLPIFTCHLDVTKRERASFYPLPFIARCRSSAANREERQFRERVHLT